MTIPSDEPAAQDGNLGEIHRALHILTEPGQRIELRSVGVSRRGEKPHADSKLFFDQDALADEGLALTPHAKGVYITLNPVKPEKVAGSAEDGDIEHRRWFPVDVDPQRPKGASSTDEEHEDALALARQIRDFLVGMGWPAPWDELACAS